MNNTRDIFYFINSLDLSGGYTDSDEFINVNPSSSTYLSSFTYSNNFATIYIVGLAIDDIHIGLYFGDYGVIISFEDVLMEIDIDGKIIFDNCLVSNWLCMNSMKFMDLTFDDLKILKMECYINN